VRVNPGDACDAPAEVEKPMAAAKSSGRLLAQRRFSPEGPHRDAAERRLWAIGNLIADLYFNRAGRRRWIEPGRRFGAILNRPATGKAREQARVGRRSGLVLAWRADYYALQLWASWGVLFIERAEACV
jgi:hypothetical protein